MENSKKITFIALAILVLVFVWHIIFTFTLSNRINSSELDEMQNSIDEVQLSVNRITNLVNIKVPLPPQIDDENSFAGLGTAMAELLIQNVGPGLIERELNIAARQRFNLYAILIPFRVKIEMIPASPEAVEQATIEHQQRMEQLENEKQRALEERERELAELQREREERERRRNAELAEQQRIKDRYINDYISLENVRIAQGERFGMTVESVFGTLENKGQKTLNRVSITIYFLNNQGQRIGERSYSPVMVSDFNFGDNTPLRPGYRRDFGYSVEDDAPSNWSKKIDAVVSDIEFYE